MHTFTAITRAFAFGTALLFTACTSSDDSSGGSQSFLTSAVQDQGVDPSGHTTVFTFNNAPSGATAGDFQASSGQTAQSVNFSGDTAVVTWDERVSPSHEVRYVGGSETNGWVDVTTSDSGSSAFAISSSSQVGLGADEVTVSVTGPWLIEAEVEDPANWTYAVSGYAQDLSGSVFAYDAAGASLTITFGSEASLHSEFTLTPASIRTVADVDAVYDAMNGTSSGDSAAPSLVSVEQNLTENEYGQVIDFTFDEEMHPFFSAPGIYYQVAGNIAMSVSQPAGDVLRVYYSQPVIPGVDTVDVSGSLMDLRGNALSNAGSFAVTQPAPIANAFSDDSSATTTQNAGGDYIEIYTDQAFDEFSAVDPTAWIFTVDGVNIALGSQGMSYDFAERCFRVELDFDMQNGTDWSVTALGVLEVDGESFVGSYSGTVSGDSETPYVLTAVQNRSFDSTGSIIDVRLSEDCDAVLAEDVNSWSVSGGPQVTGANFFGSSRVVRLFCDETVLPGEHSLSCVSLEDLAGNTMGGAMTGIEIVSTDSTSPSVMATTASAYEGAGNDAIFVVFSEDMYEADCEDFQKWTFESPQGTALDLSGASFEYSSTHRTCTVTFGVATGVNFKRGDDYSITFDGVRDLGGNALGAGAATGSISYETTQPRVVDCWRDSTGDNVVVRFSEPCDWTNDTTGATRYVLRDGAGMTLSDTPVLTTTLDDGLGVRVHFGVTIQPDYTLDVYGITDLAGNHLYPDTGRGLSVEDSSMPSFAGGATVIDVVSGENNDTVILQFDRKMSPWGISDSDNYTLSAGGDEFDLGAATFGFDGDRMVWIELGRGTTDNLQDGTSYTVTVTDVQTAQGVERGFADSDVAVASGDSAFPTALVGDVRLDPFYPNCVLISCTEALDEALSADASRYALNGSPATDARLVSPRCCRVTFATIPAELDTVAFTLTDLAGNESGSISRSVVPADVTSPLLVNVEGSAVSGSGGDVISVEFSEDLDYHTTYE
ncbi:MAG: Ig-like domain-containing protein, partial [Planctomycetes bacterium]|nr:Ig-like domain-containing protein [Planctomycetota bacterium]